MVTINGEQVQAAGMTIAAYLNLAGYQLNRVVVEQNLEIISRQDWEQTLIREGDSIEILSMVGGG